MNYQRPAWAEIDLDAIRQNVTSIKKRLTDQTMFMAVVKANAYGHGLIPVAKAAIEAGADRLGVALLDEAQELRKAGIDSPIQILGEIPKSGVEELVKDDIIATVYSQNLINDLTTESDRQGKKVKVHLKIDSGMHRAGSSLADVKGLYEMIKKSDNLELEGVLTHFAVADEIENNYTLDQLDRFLKASAELADIKIRHAANSAAALFIPESQLEMVRIGISLYGLQPTSEKVSPVELKPALSLRAKIAFIKDLMAGDGVSYGLTYRANKDMRIGLIPLGYGDGYSRILSNRSEVLLQGRRIKTIGNICMDQFMVEIPEDLKVSVGDIVTLIGQDGGETISAEEIAEKLGTINYEVTCMINNRIPRRFL